MCMMFHEEEQVASEASYTCLLHFENHLLFLMKGKWLWRCVVDAQTLCMCPPTWNPPGEVEGQASEIGDVAHTLNTMHACAKLCAKFGGKGQAPVPSLEVKVRVGQCQTPPVHHPLPAHHPVWAAPITPPNNAPATYLTAHFQQLVEKLGRSWGTVGKSAANTSGLGGVQDGKL